MKLTPFQMERWQSTYENQVDLNLSESGVHPLTVGELLNLGDGAPDLGSVGLGYGHTNGSEALRASIADLYPGASERSVVVTVGGAEANFVSFWQQAVPGGAAAVLLPTYQQVTGLIQSFDGQIFPCHLREEHGWKPDLDELSDALERGASFISLTNPNNPSGAILSEQEMDRIVSLADRHGAWILSDEVYQGAEIDGKTTPSFWGRYDRVLITNSLSKAYGLPGLRLGWVLGPEKVVEELLGRKDYTTIGPSVLSDTLGTHALSSSVRPKILLRTRSILQKNLAVLEDWLASQNGMFEWTRPQAGAMCMTRYHAPIKSLELADRLRTKHSLLIVPGAHYDIEHTLRIGFGIDDLSQALQRLGEGFAGLPTS